MNLGEKILTGEIFAQNVLLVIDVPSANLKGVLFDNGLARISTYSDHISEAEVLVNAFNVFKIRGFQEAGLDEKAHTVYLEYGSMKLLEEKVKKSQYLLEAEYNHRVNCNDLQKIKQLLKEKKEQMTKGGYQQILKQFPSTEKKLRQRKQYLEEWRREEYEQAVKKLSQWDKQLILNTKHQEKEIYGMENYGELLFAVGDYKRASRYFRKRLKQVELDRALEGHYWRNNQCLIFKQTTFRKYLSFCYYHLNRQQQFYLNTQQLLDLLVFINRSSSPLFLYFLVKMFYFCTSMRNKEEERKKYYHKLMEVLKQEGCERRKFYKEIKKIKQMEEKKEEREKEEKKKEEKEGNEEGEQKQRRKKQKKERRKKVRQIKQQLRQIELETYGKYTSEYLIEMHSLISLLSNWGYQSDVIKEGKEYFQIRREAPHVGNRIGTGAVLRWVLDACVKQNKKQQFESVCKQFAAFQHSHVHNFAELAYLLQCLLWCIEKWWWRAGQPIVEKLLKTKVNCGLEVKFAIHLILSGYVVLVFSGSQQCVIMEFLQWGLLLYEQQFTQKENTLIIIKQVVLLNKKYNQSNKSYFHTRKKDYYDERIYRFVKQCLRNEKITVFPSFVWCKHRGQIIHFQRPFYQLEANMKEVTVGFDEFMSRGELVMGIKSSQQLLEQNNHILYRKDTQQLLRRVRSLSQLHLHEWHLNSLPSLLFFYSEVQELLGWQMKEIKLDEKVVQMNEHMNEGVKKQWTSYFVGERNSVRNSTCKEDGPALSRMKKIYARYKYYQEHYHFGIRRFKSKEPKFRTREDWELVRLINKQSR